MNRKPCDDFGFVLVSETKPYAVFGSVYPKQTKCCTGFGFILTNDTRPYVGVGFV